MRLLIVILLLAFSKCDDYFVERAKILELEAKMSLGGNITLTHKEAVVNSCLMSHKYHEVDEGFLHPENYNFSQHYFKYKDRIPHSKVYKIIKSMPKGAVLHVHDTAILGPDYFLKITYMDHVYVCSESELKFLFSDSVPKVQCNTNWRLMSDLRRTIANVTKFDLQVRKQFTIAVKNPEIVYPSIQESWTSFQEYFPLVDGLLWYKPVWVQYVHDVLTAFKDDHVMYAEIRSSVPDLYELNGYVHDKLTTIKIYKDVVDRFVLDNPDFYGVKLIVNSGKWNDVNNVSRIINSTKEIMKKVPDFIVGFDLVGREDTGRPLLDYVPAFKGVKDLNFFFHAGETGWYGTPTDENLIDAVLLGAKRIGHGYALTKHPVVMKKVIENDIALEVNVVSNVVLSLVKDVRNHPLSVWLSQGLPVVLSSDDPGAWEADPLSDDFYIAFVGVASKKADLRMLKTLALNSLKYSALDGRNKQKAIRLFNLHWNTFIDLFDCSLF